MNCIIFSLAILVFMQEPINWHDALCNVDGDSTYNVVQIQQKELEMI